MPESPVPDPTSVDLRICVARDAAAAIEEFLWTLDPGAVAQVIHEDEAELRVTLPTPDAEGIVGHLAAFINEAGLATPITVETTPFREEDWANVYRQEFEPIFVGECLVVAPTWWDGPLPTDRTTLRIDPQMAFGTGHHPTTRACLEWLAQRRHSR